jgi:hypothetical protein
MKATKVILSVVLLLIAGCTAVTITEETPISQPIDPTETQPKEPPMSETAESDPTPTDDDSKQVSEPITIDLSAVTPEPIAGTPVVRPVPGNPGVKDPVLLAVADLSNRLNVTADAIDLVSLQEVTWRDGSLGCPEAGMSYIQALSPGQQMILRVNGQDYYYHSGKSGVFNYCGDPQPPIENMGINPNQPPPPGKDD